MIYQLIYQSIWESLCVDKSELAINLISYLRDVSFIIVVFVNNVSPS